MADNANAFAAESTEASDDRIVVTEFAIAGKRNEIAYQRRDVVHAMGALRMARDLRLLPWIELIVELLERLRRFRLQARDLLANGGCAVARLQRAQLVHLGFDFSHRLFKIEIAAHEPFSGTCWRRNRLTEVTVWHEPARNG